MASKYKHVIKAVFGAEWAILPEKMEQIRELLELRAQGINLTQEQITGRVGLMEPPQNHQRNQVAVLNLFGTVSQRMNALSSFSGGTSTEMFAKAFREAVDNPEISAIVINIDSPGGAVPGVPELADLIYSSRDKKRIVTVVNPMMASAALWIGTAAGEVVAVPSASDIGSIGVLTMHTDQSGANEADGVKHTIITSTEFKAEGNPHEPLSEGAKQHFQSRVMSIHGEFVDAVARNRGVTVGKVESEFGKGRTFRAKEALAIGLIDRIATFEDVLAELGAGASSSSQVAAKSPSQSFESKRTKSMNAKIKLQLVKAGLCAADATDDAFNSALALHCDANDVDQKDDDAILASFDSGPATNTSTEPTGTSTTTVTTNGEGASSSPTAMSHADLQATIKLSGITAEQQLDLLGELTPKLASLTLPQVLDRVNKVAEENTPTAGYDALKVTQDSADKFHAAARDALLVRTIGSKLPEQIFNYQTGNYDDWKPSRTQYGLASLPKLAEQCLVQAGVPYAKVANLAPMQVAQLVMGGDPSQFGLGGMLASSDGPAYNVSGMFSNILLDAANVTLRRSYDDARTTFQLWMRQAPSISDFKAVNRVIAGELGDPKAVPEDGEFDEVTLTDGKESYKLNVWGSIFSMSWQLIVNDQLGSFTEIPGKMGRSMRRKQNRLAYQVVNDNSNLADGVALFSSATHTNRQTGANADAAALKAKWATAEKNMAEQTGLDTDSGSLNLEPRYVIFPPALADTVKTALNSQSLDSNNPGVSNTMQGAYEPIKDAQMGAGQGGSDTRYILAADSSDVDTIEYAYLQGLEAPVIEQEMSFTSLGMKRRIYQAFAVKAIDFRGLQDDTGA